MTTIILAFATSHYPVKPVRIVIGFAAGGETDIATHAVALQLTENLKLNVLVENRPGASGTIGADHVARAAPDGYTLFAGSQTTHAVVPQMMANPPYHPLRDFSPVTQMVYSPMLVVVHPSLPIKSMGDLIKLAKTRLDDLTAGHGGTGTTVHMATELFKLRIGVKKLLTIGYKGEAPAIIDLVGGGSRWSSEISPRLLLMCRLGGYAASP